MGWGGCLPLSAGIPAPLPTSPVAARVAPSLGLFPPLGNGVLRRELWGSRGLLAALDGPRTQPCADLAGQRWAGMPGQAPKVAGSSGSAVEIHLDHVPEAQDSQEVKSLLELLEQPGLPRGSRPLLTSHPPQPGPSTCASSRIGSTITAVSGGTSSSSSIQARATQTSRKRRDSRPRYKRHVGDRCFIRVALAEDSGHKVQSILVTDQDRAPAVIRKALEDHELAGEQPTDYQLVQILSGDGTLQIPDDANVYYAMAPSPDYRFLLLRKTMPLDAQVKERALSALHGSWQKGPRFRKGKL
ncbi:ral guanine nucleotide dissociation stimulator-like [Dasypus novemcinctus]|uniref:ral guanine nucleotide dissociation stimulator-like n=1 Tax=Dasypus novemcinctus TaxID=9361 RepID=UPI00265FEEA3|nr:ral guanine nucleotide dissociation stimulator-like [Dasypus novemcinctus]